MLIEFRVKNFRSFREEAILNMVASNYDQTLPENFIAVDIPGFKNGKIVKAAAIYGANASGKSNFIAAIEYMKSFVEGSFSKLLPGQTIGVMPFRLDEQSTHEPSSFEVTFILEGVRHLYRFSLTSERVTEEVLIVYPKGKPQVWFERLWKGDKYQWSPPTENFRYDSKLREMTRDNALFLSTGAQLNHPQLFDVYGWFPNQLRFIALDADRQFLPSYTNGLHKTRPDLFQKVIEMIREADFGIAGVDVYEKKIPLEEVRRDLPPALFSQLEASGKLADPTSTTVQLKHTGKGDKLVSMDASEESAGTRRFYALCGPWLDILEGGYTVCIDELENSLHPLLVKALLKLLFDPKTNPKGAQILFTTHNPTLLNTNTLRRDQIWFSEKRPEGDSFLYPLTDYKPRAQESLERGYLGGRYGAVPFFKSNGALIRS